MMNRVEALGKRSKKYSFQDFTGKKLLDADDLNDVVIIGSCFYQVCLVDHEGEPLMHIFPEDMRGATFIECNLDNVYVPPGNTVDSSCSRLKAKYMNDGENWILDDNLAPVEPVRKTSLLALGENVDPARIPSKRIPAIELRRKSLEQLTAKLEAKISEQ